jgi:hypothetical protein
MALQTVSDLTSAVQDWLFDRADLAARVPDFITMFEAKANRSLKCRQMEVRAVATIDPTIDLTPDFVDLPSDFQTMRRVRMLNGASPKQYRLRFVTGAQIDDFREKNPDPGQPVWFSILSDEMEVWPVPATSFQLEMVYRAYIPALSSIDASNRVVTTNWLLALAPDAYLYGALMEAAPYLHDDDRIQVWSSGVTAAIQALNDLSDDALFNAGPLVMHRKARGYS